MKKNLFLFWIVVIGIVISMFFIGCIEEPVVCGKCQYKIENKCIDYACCADSDCDDKNPDTADFCENPSTLNSNCKHKPIDLCGNGEIDSGETSENCCIDTGCIQDKKCEENKCVEKKSEYVVAVKEKDSFFGLAEYFAEKKNAKLIIFNNIDDLVEQLRSISPEYLAVVLSPEELTPDFIDEIDEKLREIDEDLFLDVSYGIITSFSIEEGYIYVDKLLDHKTPEDFSIYGINQGYFFKRLKEWYGIEVFDRCVEGYGSSACNDEFKATVDRIAKEAKEYEILNFGLHGTPDAMVLDNGESLNGTINGLIGKKPTGEMECYIEGNSEVCTAKIEELPVALNSSLVSAFSCTTVRINGKPSVVHTEYGDTDVKGEINSSIVLSALKSGALNYIGSAHVANSAIFPNQTIALEAILKGEPIGIALKDFKNNYIFNKIFAGKTLESKPKSSDFTIGFIEYHVRNWVLFGDPSIIISNKNIKPKDCIQEYKESSEIQTIEEKNYLLKNVETTVKFNENETEITNTQLLDLPNDDMTNVSANSSCAIHIQLEGKLKDYNVSFEGVNERFNSYFEENGIIENAGDELIIIIPFWVSVGGQDGTVKLNFSIRMDK